MSKGVFKVLDSFVRFLSRSYCNSSMKAETACRRRMQISYKRVTIRQQKVIPICTSGLKAHERTNRINLDTRNSIFQFAVPFLAIFADKRAFQKLVYFYLQFITKAACRAADAPAVVI